MTQVWKYEIDLQAALDGGCVIDIPRGGRILSIQAQGHKIMAWVAFCPSPSSATEAKRIVALPTGLAEKDLDALRYVSTVQLTGGTVWHFWVGLA